MGLDLIVEGRARPGFEPEWRDMVERTFGDGQLTDADKARFAEISSPAHENVGAPRVGYDRAADEWIIEVKEAKTPEEIAAVLKDFHGYYALSLVSCDGIPEFSHGQLYEGVDETSFRGAFLDQCIGILDRRLLEEAWNSKLPEAAVGYGQALLSAADAAEQGDGPEAPQPKLGFLARLGLGKKTLNPIELDEQLEIVRAAGRWFVYWGERGHPIRAWY